MFCEKEISWWHNFRNFRAILNHCEHFTYMYMYIKQHEVHRVILTPREYVEIAFAQNKNGENYSDVTERTADAGAEDGNGYLLAGGQEGRHEEAGGHEQRAQHGRHAVTQEHRQHGAQQH